MKQHIETENIILAATLKVQGYSLNQIEKQGNRGIFHFSDVDPDALMAFDLGHSQVEPNTFNNALRTLTSACRRIP